MKEIQGFRRPKSREDYLADVRDTEAAYDQNPFDKKNVKNWITAVMYATGGDPSYREEDLKLVYDARSKLEAALKTDERDWDTMFELGNIYYQILQWDTFYYNQSTDEFKNLHAKAVACFKEVQEKVPDVGRTDAMLEGLKRIPPRVRFNPCDKDLEEVEDLNDFDLNVFGAQGRYMQYRKESEDEFIKDSTAENANRWGRDLMGLAFYTRDPFERLALTEEAEMRFNKAFELDSKNIDYQLALAKACLSICCLKQGDNYTDLLKECDKLEDAAAEAEESRKRKRDS